MQNYEKKLSEAKELLDKLNDPDITLHQGMDIYKKGTEILDQATKILEKAKFEYEEIKK